LPFIAAIVGRTVSVALRLNANGGMNTSYKIEIPSPISAQSAMLGSI
jgi:hypothetical protein